MMLVFAEFERDMISERTSEKRLETIKAGLWPGGHPPVGYNTVNKKLVINDEEASTVREIFNRYIEKKSASKVVRSLNKDGYQTKLWKTKKGTIKGGANFGKNKLLRILKSRIYLGEYEHNDKVYEGKHDAIVNHAQFDAVQKIISQNSSDPKVYVSGSTPANLTGISYCALCKSALTTTSTKKKSTGNKYYYYKCVKKNKEGKTECHSPKDLPVSTLDEFVASTLCIMLEQPELLKAFRKRNRFDSDVAEKNLKNKKQRLSDSLKNINKEITNTVNFISKNAAASTDDTLQDKLTELNLKKREIQDEYEFCSKKLLKLSNQKPLNNDVYKNILNEFLKKWSDERYEHKETVLKTVIRKVESSVETDNSRAVEVQYIADKNSRQNGPK